MSELSSYGKIYAVGHRQVRDLFQGPVVVQEKVDGSQFSFGVIGGVLFARSKGSPLDVSIEHAGLFGPAMATVKRLSDCKLLSEGWVYRGEAICKPKHNALSYDRAPLGGVILYDVDTNGLQNYLSPSHLAGIASMLGLECVPVLFEGTVASKAELDLLLKTTSCLGGAQIEGVVVKNYARFGADGKTLMGKIVSEGFKEVAHREWTKANPKPADVIDEIIGSVRTEARWHKAVTHFRDDGKLDGSPKDIGPLIKEIQKDISDEEKEEIKERLWTAAQKRILHGAIRGFPEWYKQQLVASAFDMAHVPSVAEGVGPAWTEAHEGGAYAGLSENCGCVPCPETV